MNIITSALFCQYRSESGSVNAILFVACSLCLAILCRIHFEDLS